MKTVYVVIRPSIGVVLNDVAEYGSLSDTRSDLMYFTSNFHANIHSGSRHCNRNSNRGQRRSSTYRSGVYNQDGLRSVDKDSSIGASHFPTRRIQCARFCPTDRSHLHLLRHPANSNSLRAFKTISIRRLLFPVDREITSLFSKVLRDASWSFWRRCGKFCQPRYRRRKQRRRLRPSNGA